MNNRSYDTFKFISSLFTTRRMFFSVSVVALLVVAFWPERKPKKKFINLNKPHVQPPLPHLSFLTFDADEKSRPSIKKELQKLIGKQNDFILNILNVSLFLIPKEYCCGYTGTIISGTPVRLKGSTAGWHDLNALREDYYYLNKKILSDDQLEKNTDLEKQITHFVTACLDTDSPDVLTTPRLTLLLAEEEKKLGRAPKGTAEKKTLTINLSNNQTLLFGCPDVNFRREVERLGGIQYKV